MMTMISCTQQGQTHTTAYTLHSKSPSISPGPEQCFPIISGLLHLPLTIYSLYMRQEDFSKSVKQIMTNPTRVSHTSHYEPYMVWLLAISPTLLLITFLY